jgi:flagellar biosynthesis protein FlhA
MTMKVLTLEAELEDCLADYTPGPGIEAENTCLMGEAQREQCFDDWVDQISSAARGMEEKGYPPVILCSPKARFPVKEATRKNFPALAVLSYLEVPSDIRVEPVGEIRRLSKF